MVDAERLLRGATLRSEYLASHYAVLEAERLLRRAVTIIVRDTSATSSSQSDTQCVCIRGSQSEAG